MLAIFNLYSLVHTRVGIGIVRGAYDENIPISESESEGSEGFLFLATPITIMTYAYDPVSTKESESETEDFTDRAHAQGIHGPKRLGSFLEKTSGKPGNNKEACADARIVIPLVLF